MNTHSKRATFSPDQEKSNVQENFQNRCRGRAGGWDTGGSRRSSQENRTTLACRGVLRITGANMPGQPGLSRYKEVNNSKRSKRANFSSCQEKSNAKKNSQNHCSKHAYAWGSSQRRRSSQENRTALACRGVLRCAAAVMPRQPWLSRLQVAISSKRVL
jgi:hypothetical protein